MLCYDPAHLITLYAAYTAAFFYLEAMSPTVVPGVDSSSVTTFFTPGNLMINPLARGRRNAPRQPPMAEIGGRRRCKGIHHYKIGYHNMLH